MTVIKVPQIKGLTVHEILKEARKHIDIDTYMPKYQGGKHPDRDFVWNVGMHLRINEII